MNATDDTRHGKCGTARASMMSYGEHQGSWSMSIAASVLSWRGAVERCRELQSRVGASSGGQGS